MRAQLPEAASSCRHAKIFFPFDEGICAPTKQDTFCLRKKHVSGLSQRLAFTSASGHLSPARAGTRCEKFGCKSQRYEQVHHLRRFSNGAPACKIQESI